MSKRQLSKDQQDEIITQLQDYLEQEHDLRIGNLEAASLLDELEKTLGACFYNQGLQDAAAVTSRKAEDVIDELYALERPTPFSPK
ncbi:MAG: DUF2164 domain-containing protein [Rhodobacteraceae bacterium]|nr:DUF2164 domain-containing protein [Paracoccaceae bacterium]